MTQYTEQWNALDVIAERIRALGFAAPGTYKQFVKLTSIKEVEGVPKAEEMIRLLVDAHETVARTARSIFRSLKKPMISRPLTFSRKDWKYTKNCMDAEKQSGTIKSDRIFEIRLIHRMKWKLAVVPLKFGFILTFILEGFIGTQ